jgi:uncharacterized iron-regulated protein
MKSLIFGLAALASSVAAEGTFDAQVVFLGEVHDNPAHHARQAQMTAELAPRAIVWEMLSPEAAGKVTPDLITDAVALETALGWADSGWPDFSMYYPIFAAAPDAAQYGAQLPRDEARAVMGQSLDAVFGEGAVRFGLDAPLPEGQQEAREALQMAAHCDALPAEMLPMMVDIQRLRDAKLASAALAAFEQTGGPVVVITGNGHARPDWGAPFMLAQAAPALQILTLGQAEDGNLPPDGGFDLIETSPAVDRGDPCEAFRQ